MSNKSGARKTDQSEKTELEREIEAARAKVRELENLQKKQAIQAKKREAAKLKKEQKEKRSIKKIKIHKKRQQSIRTERSAARLNRMDDDPYRYARELRTIENRIYLEMRREEEENKTLKFREVHTKQRKGRYAHDV